MKEFETTVLGLGNLLMKDEGIGVHIANLLIKHYSFSPEITIIDGGTTGTDLLPYFESSERILIIDAVNFEEKPGHIGIIKNDDILSAITSKISLHHLGLSDVLSVIKLIDIKPEEVILIGIQPYRMELGMDLSEEMQKQVPAIISTVLQKLEEWDISFYKTV
jgi:hydrogenase maturation protease